MTSVIEEIEKAVLKDDVGLIDFEDEHLSLDKTWFLNLLDQIVKRFGNLNHGASGHERPFFSFPG